ncbi:MULTISPECIES: hypothetical protein [unclassified Methylobacterium]|nr:MULTISPECIES: hypothetical protein [unclassified Methylobacterium]
MLWGRCWPFSIPPDQIRPRDLAYIEARMRDFDDAAQAEPDGLADDE